MTAQHDVDAMIGTSIGRYVIRSKLAEGGMGAVYIAEHARLSTRKVVKVLLAEYSRNEIIRQRFEREATAASRLRHASIITIDDFGALPDGQLFLMMPFLDGKPLDAHIREHAPMSLHHALLITLQLCSALQHLHDAGIVHRDLKPGNVFLTSSSHPYEVTLIDLGIARLVAEKAGPYKTETGMAMGTPGYMAVEQYGNAANAGPAADLYAVAIIVWEMLTGQLPWGNHDPRVLYHKQMTERPEPPAVHAIPANVLSLLMQTLSPRPELRPLSARGFAVALASKVLAIPPHLPSGAEILVRFAPEFAQHASPNLETVRNAAGAEHAHQLAPMAWPYRTTAPSNKLPTLPNEVPLVAMRLTTPAMPATVDARPPAAIPQTTTLGASSGVSVPIVRPPLTHGRLALLAVGACALATVVAFAAIRRGDATENGMPAGGRIENSVPRDAATPLVNAAVVSPDASLATPVAVPVDAATAWDAGATGPSSMNDATAKPGTAKKSTRSTDADSKRSAGATTKSTRGSAAKPSSAAALDPDAVEE